MSIITVNGFRKACLWCTWLLGLFALLCAVDVWALDNAIHLARDSWRKVKVVLDGDTIIVDNGTHVRYLGINAPEIAHDGELEEPFGPEAARLNNKLVGGKMVKLSLDQEVRDKYGRYLAYVFLDDGTFVNGEIVKAGLATVLYHPPNVLHSDKLIQLQQQAIKKSMGLWRAINNANNDAKTPYTGNKRSRRFHSVICSLGKTVSPSNKISFKGKLAAYEAGYSPCKQCKP